MECLRPIFDSGVEVCIDAQAYHLRSEFSLYVYNLMKDYGVTMSIEATPRYGTEVYNEQAAILWHLFYKRHVQHRWPGAFPLSGAEDWYEHDPRVILREKDLSIGALPRIAQCIAFNGVPMVPRNTFHNLVDADLRNEVNDLPESTINEFDL